MNPLRASLSVLLLALFAVAPAIAAEAPFPSRPVRIVVGFTPGTTTDATARMLGPRLADRLGQPVVIENREGSNSGIANGIVGRATPDGHTLLIGTLSHVVSPLLYKDLPFDPRDFAPVSLLVLAQNVMAVNPKLEAASIKELIALAKSRPGQLRYASSGRGSSAFLTVELLKSMAGVDLQEIPYKSTGQAVTDFISGEVAVYPPSMVAALPLMRAGRIRALAVTGAKRSPLAPELPTIGETLPGYDAATGVYGIMVPAKTPTPVIDRLHREIAAIAQSEDFRSRMQALGVDTLGTTPAEYAAFLRESGAKWKALFERIGVGRL
jgi:tripartite-type tricarboxylate transporter receptor subunit TctC